MIKLTALYGHPTDPTAFEKYYATTHMPLVAKISGVIRHEKAKVVAQGKLWSPTWQILLLAA